MNLLIPGRTPYALITDDDLMDCSEDGAAWAEAAPL